MRSDNIACIIGLAIAVVFGGALLIDKMRTKTRRQEEQQQQTATYQQISPCQRAALARAAAQGAVGRIPLPYANAPMAAYNTNPDRRQ